MLASPRLPAPRALRAPLHGPHGAGTRLPAPVAAARGGAGEPPRPRAPPDLRPLERVPGAGARGAPRGVSQKELKECRRWQAVLAEHAQRSASRRWGSAGALASLRRLARVLTLFDKKADKKLDDKAGLVRARAEAAQRDTRFEPLMAEVIAALPALDLGALDAARTAFAAVNYGRGVEAADAAAAARFAAQSAAEAVADAPDADSLLHALVSASAPPDATAATDALRALVALCASPEEAARACADPRFDALLDAVARAADADMGEAHAAACLDALQRLGMPRGAPLSDALAAAFVRRGVAAGGDVSLPPHAVLLFLSAASRLGVRLRPRGAAVMAAVVARMLPGCPPKRLASLLCDALAVGATPQPLLDAAAPCLAAAVAAAPGAVPRLTTTLQVAGASAELLATLQVTGAAAASQPARTRVMAAAVPALRLRRSRMAVPMAQPLRRVASAGCSLSSGRTRRSSSLRAAPSADAGEVINWPTALAAFVVPAVGGALFGYDIGVTSGALVSLKGAATSGTDWGVALTSLQSGAVVSSSLAGAVAGSALALTLGERVGRRAELLAAAVLYFSGAALMATAPSLELLVAGRALYGGGIGFAMHGAPIYIAETAPPSVRGAFISAKEAFIVGGILLGYVAGAVLVDAEAGWRTMLGVSALPALVLGAGMLLLPDSPRWLAQAGKGAAAAGDALAALRGAAVPRAAIDAEVAGFSGAAGPQAAAGLGALLAPKNARALYAGLSLMLFQQITGQPSVLYYATPIMQRAGFASASAATQVAVVLGAFKLAMTGVAVLSVDRLGRRPLLLAGVGALTVALLLLAELSGPTPPLTGDAGAYASAACLLLYVGAYQVSFGPIAWLIVSEVFPQDVRTAAVGVATITNFGANFGVSLLLPLLQEAAGQDGTYRVFAALGVLSLISIALTIPETKGKTLEQIEAELSK